MRCPDYDRYFYFALLCLWNVWLDGKKSTSKTPSIDIFYVFRKKKLVKSPSSTLEVAEQREKRVLVQMSVLVLAFLLMCAPFFITFAVIHWCQPSPSMFEEVYNNYFL